MSTCTMKRTLLVLFLLSKTSSGANILAFFHFPVLSHHNVFRPILNELANRGHNVTYVSPYKYDSSNANIRHILLENHRETLLGGLSVSNWITNSPITMAFLTTRAIDRFHDKLFSSEIVQEIIHSNEKYDVVLSSSMLFQEPVAALVHKFKAIGIDIHPVGDVMVVNELTGLPVNSNYMVDFKADFKKGVAEFTYRDKLYNTCILLASYLALYYRLFSIQTQVDKYFNYTGWETRPPIGQLVTYKSLVLTNSHHSVGYSSPKAPHVKEIGGVNVLPIKPLPKEIEDFMNGAKDGVIYFSLGTNFNVSAETSSDLRQVYLKVLSRVKQRVLWKWDGDQFPGRFENIKFSKWFPQGDILAHKNLKLFITQGGILSLNEAVYNGLPLICMPFIGDQPKNADVVVANGFGVRLNFQNLTELHFQWAIDEVLANPSYAKNAKKWSEIFRDRPMAPLDEAVYWIEFVIRNGNVLQPRAVHLPFYQLHNLDVMLTFAAALYLMLYAIKYMWLSFFGAKKSQELKKKNE